MAITTIGGSINSTAVLPNLDYKYGPYNSLQEAYDALGPEGADKLVIGLTVGIIQNGEITEYWFRDGTDLEDLVLKVSGSGDVDYSQLSNKPSINNVTLSGNKTSSDLDLYTKPATGIPSTDLSSAVQTSLGKADISVSNTVNDLVNYYLKTETYTQTEVNNLIGSIYQFHFEVYASLSDITNPSSNVFYLIGPDSTVTGGDQYEEYVYANNQFVKIGDTSIDLSGYAEIDGEYNNLHSGYTKNIGDGETETNAQFTFRPTANHTKNIETQYSNVEKIQGNSVAWNQLMPLNQNYTEVSCSSSVSDDIITFTASAQVGRVVINIPSLAIANHKFYVKVKIKTTATADKVQLRIAGTPTAYNIQSGNWQFLSTIVNAPGSVGIVDIRESDWDAIQVDRHVIFIDLTILGIDNFTTVEEVKSWLAANVGLRDYYPYNAGEIINCKVQGITTNGFNQWNEEWELGGYDATGAKQASSDSIRSKNHIEVFPSTQYYFKRPTGSSSWVYYYDIDKNFISYYQVGNNVFTTPSNCHYITFKYGYLSEPRTTYNHDICINLSNTTKNGTYQPYWTETKEFDVTKIYGKLNGEGELVQVFPNGMRKAGSVQDVLTASEAVVKIVSVDLGTLNGWSNTSSNHRTSVNLTGLPAAGSSYTIPNILCDRYITIQPTEAYSGSKTGISCSGSDAGKLWLCDASLDGKTGEQVKSAVDGIYLNYELATPLEYTDLMYEISTGVYEPFNLPLGYIVSEYGTEQQVFPEPTPPSDSLTSVSGILDLTYDVVDGLEFIKNTDDKLGDLDYRASRVEDRLDNVDSEIDDLKIPLQSSMPSGGMLPNVVYNLGTLSSNTTFTLATPTDNTVLNHWYWTFDIGSTVPTLTWPAGIVWAGDNLSPIIEANKHYEVSVINNIGTYIYSVVI